MFDSERWSEIWITLTRNKLRSGLTMFGVFWGIFMLVIMLGMGKGLSNGVLGGFSGWATNSCFMWTQSTSVPYAGFKRGRRFNFDNSDIATIKAIPGVDQVAPRLQLGGYRGANNVNYKDKNGGRLDYRFNRELTAWLNENPLFTGDAPPAPPPPPDQGQPAAPQGNLSPDISGLLDYYSQPQTTPFAKQSSQ